MATNTSIYAWALLTNHIHLNPLRAKLVKSLTQLDRYRWSGHGVFVGKIKNEWQDPDYALRWFGQKQGEAKKAYRSYVKKGLAEVARRVGVSTTAVSKITKRASQ